MCIYVYICVYMCIYVYIYIYIWSFVGALVCASASLLLLHTVGCVDESGRIPTH